VELSKGDNKPNKLNAGNIPLVSSGSTNNGVVKMIENGDEKSQPFNAGTITFDMFGTVFSQPKDFYAVSHGRVNMLRSKDKITNSALLFITTILDKEKYRFNYGRAAYSNVIANLKIKLPTKNHRPDYDFMTNFVQTLPFSSQIC
jgi:hypothetical protein